MQESVANVQLVVHLFGWVGEFFMGQRNCFCSILSGFYVQNCSRWIFIVTHWSDKEILERYHEIFLFFSSFTRSQLDLNTRQMTFKSPQLFWGLAWFTNKFSGKFQLGVLRARVVIRNWQATSALSARMLLLARCLSAYLINKIVD